MTTKEKSSITSWGPSHYDRTVFRSSVSTKPDFSSQRPQLAGHLQRVLHDGVRDGNYNNHERPQAHQPHLGDVLALTQVKRHRLRPQLKAP